MTDVKSRVNPLFLTDASLRQGIELMFFAYRAFTEEADRILEAHGLGRAHHRVIYFVGRHPELTVTELLDILKITKQSLSRVLNQLMAEDFVAQAQDARDRRRRKLKLTGKGRALEEDLTARQMALLAKVYRGAGAEAVEGFHQVLMGLVTPADRHWLPPQPGTGHIGPGLRRVSGATG